jgi:hypothetical protein
MQFDCEKTPPLPPLFVKTFRMMDFFCSENLVIKQCDSILILRTVQEKYQPNIGHIGHGQEEVQRLGTFRRSKSDLSEIRESSLLYSSIPRDRNHGFDPAVFLSKIGLFCKSLIHFMAKVTYFRRKSRLSPEMLLWL